MVVGDRKIIDEIRTINGKSEFNVHGLCAVCSDIEMLGS